MSEPSETLTKWIGVRIMLPDPVAARLSFMPADNFIGSLLLVRLIEASLPLDGVMAQALLVGPLNRLHGVVLVDDLRRGLTLVQGVIAPFGLCEFLELAWFDHGAHVWRKYPDNSVSALNEVLDFDKLLETAQRQAAATKACKL